MCFITLNIMDSQLNIMPRMAMCFITLNIISHEWPCVSLLSILLAISHEWPCVSLLSILLAMDGHVFHYSQYY